MENINNQSLKIELINKKAEKMVDSDFFTEFNKFLVIEQNRILLDYKNCDYTLEL